VKRIAGFLLVVGVLFAVVGVLKSRPAHAPDMVDSTGISAGDRDRIRRFWETYRRATDHRVAGRSGEAEREYTQALALNPEHQDALYYLGSMHFDLGNLAAAERAWRRLVEIDPTNGRGHSQLGMLYSCVGAPASLQLASATVEFQRALSINREETGPLLHLGEIALLQGELARARSYFDSVIGSNYSSVEAHYYEGYLAWKTGASQRAAELLATAVRYARPSTPTGGVPGEGDTRAGQGPMVTIPTNCRPMRARMEDLRALDDDDVPRRVDHMYRELDDLLRDVRLRLPQ
jgi:hypothetical protein